MKCGSLHIKLLCSLDSLGEICSFLVGTEDFGVERPGFSRFHIIQKPSFAHGKNDIFLNFVSGNDESTFATG